MADKGSEAGAGAVLGGCGCMIVLLMFIVGYFAACNAKMERKAEESRRAVLVEQSSPDKPTAVRATIDEIWSAGAFAEYADAPGGEAIVRVKIDDWLAAFAWGKISRSMRALLNLPAIRDAQTITLDLYQEKQDTLGNRTWRRTVALTMTREKAQQVQWENITGEDEVRRLFALHGKITPGL